MRVGFVGELGYEIHAPADCGEALWDALMEAGADHAIRPFGVEAQRLLRLEKGHIIVGQDTDGLTTPAEAAMAWAVARRKPFFVGARAIDIRSRRPPARRLVGFVLRAPDADPPEECCLVVQDGAIAGRVTSAMRSPTLGRAIGLAFVPPAIAAPGSGFTIRRPDGAMVAAEVAQIPFYDPDNARQEGWSVAGCAPTDFTRRSFVYRRLAAAGARFAPAGDQAVARDFGDPAAEGRARALSRPGRSVAARAHRVPGTGGAFLARLPGGAGACAQQPRRCAARRGARRPACPHRGADPCRHRRGCRSVRGARPGRTPPKTRPGATASCGTRRRSTSWSRA